MAAQDRGVAMNREPGHALNVGDTVTFEGVLRWPLLVRFAAWLSRVKLPKREAPLQQFIVSWSSSNTFDIAP